MNRRQLEHIIRAAAQIVDEDELVILGSQAILGQYPQAPADLLVSMEVDLYPLHRPDLADLVDGTLGELSPFHETFGYYAQGVGPTTATLPSGWETRLIPVSGPSTRGATGWCLEAHDLVISKLVASREKDLVYAQAALHHRLVRLAELRARLANTPLADERLRPILEARLTALGAGEGPRGPA
jgi:hypothetical protein